MAFPLINPGLQFFDNTGLPLSGGLLYSYAPGTTTPKTTYTDEGLSVPNANPIVLDSAGRCTIFLTNGEEYKFVLKTSAEVTLWTRDNIKSPSTLVQADVGGLLWPRTAAEIAGGVTPSNYAYEPYNALRYMNASQITDVTGGTGLVDVTTALQTLFTLCGTNAFIAHLPTGVYRISSGLTYNGGGGIWLEHAGFGNAVSYIKPVGSGYTALTVASSGGTQLSRFSVTVGGSGNTVNGIKFGTNGSANLQMSKIDFVRVYNLDGFGVSINDCWDTWFGTISIQECGNASNYAFSWNNVTDTSNESIITRLQVELCDQKAISIGAVLNCVLLAVHSERTTGNGTDATHVFGGDTCYYAAARIEDTSNVIIDFTATNTTFEDFKTDALVRLNNGNASTYQGNRVSGLLCDELRVPASNVGSWLIERSGFNTFTYDSQAVGRVRVQFSHVFTNVNATANGSTAEFIACQFEGTWTITGNPVVICRECLMAAIPAAAQVTLSDCSVTGAYTTVTNQQVTALDCTFSQTITIATNGVKWRSDGCTFANGITLGAGTPGWLFGARDRVTGGAVSAGLLASPQGASASAQFYRGERTYSIQPAAGAVEYWVCTTSGTPGTWTASPNL
jgi:hypothetical protein